MDELKDKWATAKVEIEKFSKKRMTKVAVEYDVLAPLIENKNGLDIIDQAQDNHEKGNEKQEQLF